MTIQYSLIRSNNGISYFGGEAPSDFKIPTNNCPGSFQYLGMLSNNDPVFGWLPFSLHLICPVYMNINRVWLDYADPNNPTIINLSEINDLDSAYDDLNAESVIIYEKVNFNGQLTTSSEQGRIGLAGVPNWLQEQAIPICPKTNIEMKFLCQMEYLYENEIKVKYTNVANEAAWYKQYFETMNFWGAGDLYVFFDPESKIACYFIQNS